MSDHNRITNDLMKKIGNDVTAAMIRTLDIAPNHLPVAMAGAAAAVGVTAAILSRLNDSQELGGEPNPDMVMLAALIIGRMGLGPDGVSQAYIDLETLRSDSETGQKPNE